jgi:peroxiredoxin Q/BCP
MKRISKLKVGSSAPKFTLLNQDGEKVSLKDFIGKKVLVYFYPKAMTPGCTVQACSLRDSKKVYDKNKIVILGVSPDAPARLKKFIERDSLNFTLLSDEDHALAESFGVWGLKKFMGKEYMGVMRTSFLIDETGKIKEIMSEVKTKTHHQDILDLLK